MKLYNTLTRQKEEFVPLEENKIKMYVCGPTVYNFIHIGNARPYIVFDTIRRYFEYKGYDVNYVQNFTDVDDKIIKKANEENVSMEEIANRYIGEAVKDAEGLNVKKATHNPRVTEEMPEIIQMIENLIEKGFAYEINGTVYFSTEKFNDYGKLSGKNIEELEAGARIEVEEAKRKSTDFVVWKPCKPGEPKWDSPWGAGRPGWHIECSVMAKKYLGDTIDIHAGGEDLVFPHHENEIAQSEAANGKQFAKYWMHNGFINVDNQKMSKSKGNFFTLRDISEKFPYEVIRFYILSVHYRSPLNFSAELLQAAGNGLDRIKNSVFNINFIMENLPDEKITSEEKIHSDEINKYKIDFENKMDDDFNTADAISVIFELVKFANINVTEKSTKEFAEETVNKITELCDILGISVLQKKPQIDENEINRLIGERTSAKKNKDFAAADSIREKLNVMGITIEDTRQGVRWSYKGK